MSDAHKQGLTLRGVTQVPMQQKLVVWHSPTARNREVEDQIVDPRGGRHYWFADQNGDEGWINASDCDVAHD